MILPPNPSEDKTMKRLLRAAACGLAVLAMTSPAFAHHSFAMFDSQKTMAFDGTVTDFQFTNPHSWLEVDVPITNNPGHVTVQHWSLEMNNLVGLRRAGWKPKSLQKGDKVKVTMHPMRDGSAAGQLLTVVTADGKTLYGNGGPPGGGGGPVVN
jgi:hypothetical protein